MHNICFYLWSTKITIKQIDYWYVDQKEIVEVNSFNILLIHTSDKVHSQSPKNVCMVTQSLTDSKYVIRRPQGKLPLAWALRGTLS